MENKFNEGRLIKLNTVEGYRYNYVESYYFDETSNHYYYRMCEPENPPAYREDLLEPVCDDEIAELNDLVIVGLIGVDERNWNYRKKPKLIQSSEDPNTMYMESDGVRWIFRNGEFDGWYRP